MKKLFSATLILVLCLALASCGNVTLPRLPDAIATTEPLTTEEVIEVPSEQTVRNAFEKALEVYGWFELCALDSDFTDSVERNGHTYCRVLSEEVPTYDALRTLVYDLFDTTTGDRLLREDSETPPYIDADGALYGQDFARGADITKGEYTLTVEPENATSVLCTIKVETIELTDGANGVEKRVTGYETYRFHYQRVGRRWVFTDFDLFY